MTPQELAEKASKYRWYHPIDLGGYVTKPDNDFSMIWDFIRGELKHIDFKDKHVIDIGARDGLWSFFAERAGAAKVVALDNNLSHGMVDVAIPSLQSRIHPRELNICNLSGAFREEDIVLMLGVLYHLRFPMMGLWNACGFLRQDGLLCIETAIYVGSEDLADYQIPIIYCPYLDSPYEAGSVSFFNRLGLQRTMESMGMVMLDSAELPESQVGPIRRAFFKFRKSEMFAHLREYWTGTHTGHTSASEEAWQKEATQRHVSKSP